MKRYLLIPGLCFLLLCSSSSSSEDDSTSADDGSSTTSSSGGPPTPPCAPATRPLSLPSDITFGSNPTGFSHSATTDQLVASAGKGVLTSLASEKADILTSSASLSGSEARISADFSFSAASDAADSVQVYLHWNTSPFRYYLGQATKAGGLVLTKEDGGTTTTPTPGIIAAQATGTLVMTVCNDGVRLTALGTTVTITDASPLAAGSFGFAIAQLNGGTPGSTTIDNVGVFVP